MSQRVNNTSERDVVVRVINVALANLTETGDTRSNVKCLYPRLSNVKDETKPYSRTCNLAAKINSMKRSADWFTMAIRGPAFEEQDSLPNNLPTEVLVCP